MTGESSMTDDRGQRRVFERARRLQSGAAEVEAPKRPTGKVRNMTVGMAAAFGAKRLDRAAAIRPDSAFYARFGRSQPASCHGRGSDRDSMRVRWNAEA